MVGRERGKEVDSAVLKIVARWRAIPVCATHKSVRYVGPLWLLQPHMRQSKRHSRGKKRWIQWNALNCGHPEGFSCYHRD